MFGDVIKVTPTSKVVGDMALMMVTRDLTPEDVADPKIAAPTDVVVRIGGAGVCRTDLHIVEGVWRGLVEVEFPHIMGHENAGWVEEVGSGVTSVKVGDPVIVHPLVTSGHCLACRRGEDMHYRLAIDFTDSIAGANTGRLSSNDPNLQNIPVRTEEGRNIRRAFVAEKGHELLSADYSQIELRILAHIAGVDTLKQAFQEGVDIHALTASQVFGVPLEGMDPMVRRSAKAINFGIIYGISPFGLARQLGVAQGEAKAYIEAYFERYPGIKDYMERTKKEAHAMGYVTTLLGRRCHLPGINEKNPTHRGFSERAAINAPIQGTAADIIKRAMIVMEKSLSGAGLKARMLLQVHDELIFEAPKDEIDATAEVAQRVMSGAAHLDVPLTVDTGAADKVLVGLDSLSAPALGDVQEFPSKPFYLRRRNRGTVGPDPRPEICRRLH